MQCKLDLKIIFNIMAKKNNSPVKLLSLTNRKLHLIAWRKQINGFIVINWFHPVTQILQFINNNRTI